ncbi:MAG: MlaD family protein [Chitinivibrionales bacterium]
MSITRAQRARLGMFMISGAILIAVFIAIPVGFSLTKQEKVYYSFFQEESSLSGLEQGADIKFRGVPIGEVADITYNPREITRIKVKFRIQSDFPVKEDMYVQTGMMGITGLKYVEIMGGSDTSSLLPEGSMIESKASLMSTITGKTDVLVGKVELLLNHIVEITNPDSLAAIKEIVNNVAGISADVQTFVSGTAPELNNITTAAKSTVQKMDLIAKDIKNITDNLNRGLEADQMKQILTSVDSAAHSMKNMSEDLGLTIRQTREDFTISMENLRETLENANELSKQLAENPSLLIRGEQQRERIIR